MEFPFTVRTPQTGTEVPQTDKVKKATVCTPGDLPNCWQVCCDIPNALFLILQELMSSQSRCPAWCGEGKRKVSSRQRKPQQLLGQPLPRSPPQPWSSAAETAGRVWSGQGAVAGEPWRSGLREILQPSALLGEGGVERNPWATDQAEGPTGPPAHDSIPDEPPNLLPKSWLSVQQCQTEMETVLWRRKSGSLPLPGKGGTQ